MEGFTYGYILINDKDATHRYTGLTEDLEARLKSHNQGNNPHTSKYSPWRIETALPTILIRAAYLKIMIVKIVKSCKSANCIPSTCLS
jgi:predicted GIY-YIG superfamily endonuclease